MYRLQYWGLVKGAIVSTHTFTHIPSFCHFVGQISKHEKKATGISGEAPEHREMKNGVGPTILGPTTFQGLTPLVFSHSLGPT